MIYNVTLTGPRRLVTCETCCNAADEAEVTELMKRNGWKLARREPQNFSDGAHFVDLHWSRDTEVLETENARLWFLLQGKKKAKA